MRSISERTWTEAAKRARRDYVGRPVPMLDHARATDEKAARWLVGSLLALDVLTIALLILAAGMFAFLALW